MREILFRGKNTHTGEWIYGYYAKHSTPPNNKVCHVVFGCCPIESVDDLTEYHWNLVNPETVGQFTGLTDKNGKKIFEGDIVVCRKEICGNWIDCCVEIGFVEMKHGAFGLHRKQGYYRPFKDWLEDYEYEVIGNIHDNPELLEG